MCYIDATAVGGKRRGKACKRSWLPNPAVDAAEWGGRNRDTETNAIVTVVIAN